MADEVKVPSSRELFEEVDGEGFGDVVDPRIMLEPGTDLATVLLRASLSRAMLGRLIRVAVRFQIAGDPEADPDKVLSIIAAGYTGLEGQAREDYKEAVKFMSVLPRREEEK